MRKNGNFAIFEGFGVQTRKYPKNRIFRDKQGYAAPKLSKKPEKKCKIFPKIAKKWQKKGIFRPFYGAPRPRKWEKCLRTPRSLGGHLYAPAPKQWSIGAPPGFRVFSMKISHFRVKSRKSGICRINPFKTSQNRQKRENQRKLGVFKGPNGVLQVLYNRYINTLQILYTQYSYTIESIQYLYRT